MNNNVISIDLAKNVFLRVIADITDPDIIQKILDHIEAQPPPLNPATAIQS
jgi:hypothetical protein